MFRGLQRSVWILSWTMGDVVEEWFVVVCFGFVQGFQELCELFDERGAMPLRNDWLLCMFVFPVLFRGLERCVNYLLNEGRRLWGMIRCCKFCVVVVCFVCFCFFRGFNSCVNYLLNEGRRHWGMIHLPLPLLNGQLITIIIRFFVYILYCCKYMCLRNDFFDFTAHEWIAYNDHNQIFILIELL